MAVRKVGPDIPVIGPWIGKFGRVQDIFATPCDVDPGIWVLAFFSGAPTAMFSLFKPDAFDKVTERKFGQPHKRKTRRRFRWDDMVQLPNPKPGLQWKFFRMAQAAQRLGWYILIADVAFEWAVNWSSMAYQWSGCHDPNASWGWLACNRSNITINGAYWAGWDSTNRNGDIFVDDFSIYALGNIVASPYLEIEITPSSGAFPNAEFIEYEVRDLNTGWSSGPNRVEYDPVTNRYEHQQVWPDYTGLGGIPRYALFFRSDGRFWSMKAKLGLNGEAGRGLLSDP